MPTVSFNTHLPDYEILSELGRGNTRVLKARHIASGEIVAIKQYAFKTDADTLRRFERESQIMTQIDHPNIVRIREVQLSASMPYVVMDYVEGGDLRSLLREKNHLDVPTTIRLGVQLAGAFRAMHAMQVVHRDIKPENILYRRLVSGELHILLSDFGIAKFWTDDSIRTLTGQSLMTYEYAAPEQFDNPRQVTEAADYYALGAVLYECLTGHVPFVLQNETGLAQFMQQVLTAPLPPMTLSNGEPLPPSLETLLRGLLTRDPQQRLQNADELELLLEQSRVEYLQASRGQKQPVQKAQPTNKSTLAGPTAAAAAPVLAPTPTEPEDILVEETSGNSWQWWGLGGLVAAIALAFFIYTRATTNGATTESTLSADTTAMMPADSMQAEVEPVEDTPVVKRDTVNAEPVEPAAPVQPTPQPPADTINLNPALPDSTRTTPPDTTQ